MHEFITTVSEKINELTGTLKGLEKKKNIERRYQEIPCESVFLDINEERRKLQIEKILGQSLKEILSTGFCLYEKGELDSKTVNIFCSENMIFQTNKSNKTVKARLQKNS